MLVFAYYHLSPEWFSLIALWLIRLNVLEVLIDFIIHKEYAYCIPTLGLFFGTNLQFVKDPQHLLTITHASWFFTIEYTLWFIAWISSVVPKRFITVTHTIFPLFFPPALWASVRTLTGMVALMISYLPFYHDNYIKTEPTDIKTFARIYKPLYACLWVALYSYRFFYL